MKNKWVLKLWANGKILDQCALDVGDPIPRVGERLKIPMPNWGSQGIVPVKVVQYDYADREIWVYLVD